MAADLTLVTGGARSGKSRHALTLAAAFESKLFVATAQPFDDEMTDRIARHRQERGPSWSTLELPFDPARAFEDLDTGIEVVVLDCLTVWLSNLAYRDGDLSDDAPEVLGLIAALREPPVPVIVVSNELGMGVVPASSTVRRFRDVAGRLNQRIAAMAGTAVLMVSGLPLVLKEK